MSNNIMPFAFGDNLVRVIKDENGEPWFVAKDVALALNYEWAGIRNVQHVPEEWRRVESVSTLSRGTQEMWLLSEQGLYFFLGRSDKPGALPFQKWMAGEVMPSIRKTGTYTMPGRRASSSFLEVDMLPLPPEALGLRSSMRQRLWQDALQTARLDGADSNAAREWFAFLCRMMAATPPPPTPARDKVRSFFHECCECAQGCRVSVANLYAAFRHWHRGQRGDMPSMRSFGEEMGRLAPRMRSNGTFYRDIVLKNS